jgi:hypothetical protein
MSWNCDQLVRRASWTYCIEAGPAELRRECTIFRKFGTLVRASRVTVKGRGAGAFMSPDLPHG